MAKNQAYYDTAKIIALKMFTAGDILIDKFTVNSLSKIQCSLNGEIIYAVV